ncbi:MAG: cell division protein FtsL [Lachnospiraceae bacterium]|nr:cell division protein FtsL [Lachnospiraceae bacterium]MDE6185460.1 cell division protein FtsL [Lachnospiraceae bacterium]
MAVDERARRRAAYKNGVYVQGNTARRLQAVPDRTNEPVRKVSARTRKNRERAKHMNIGSVLSMAVAMVAAGFILTWYLTLQSDITNSIKHIAALESELNQLKRDNDENYSRITSDIDLEEVKRVAIQELGMTYAKEGQIVTFNGEGSDYVRQTGDIPN